FGTCAGLILLASRVEDGRDDQRTFGALDCEVRRNGYGPQRYSFEGMVEPVADVLEPGAGPLPAVFIRAPLVTDVWGEVQVLATVTADSAVAADSTVVADGRGGHRTPVVLRQRHVLCATFHPELTGDRRLQRLFAAMVRGEHRRADAPARATPGRPTRRREGEPMVVRR
ncbi:MAG: hypothetical protein ACRDL8_20280, partial [Solirubrobacteraceae bacterium]